MTFPEAARFSRRRISLRYLVILPFILLICLTILLVGYFSLRSGEAIVTEMVSALSENIFSRIEDQLENFLGRPQRLNLIAAELLKKGLLNPRDPAALQSYFLSLVRGNPLITSMYFGNVDGGIAGAGREGAEGTYYLTDSPGSRTGAFRKYAVDHRDSAGALLAEVRPFDVRERPWFKNAVAKGGAAWSGAYILTTGQDMAIAASRPVYDSEGRFLGVVSVDLFFSHLSAFFKSLAFGKTGIGYIVERNGLLLAASAGVEPFTESLDKKERKRTAAVDSPVPEIGASARFLSDRYAGFEKLGERLQLSFKSGNRDYFLLASPIRDSNGMGWISVIVIPKADFMAGIDANFHSTLFMMIIALFCTLVFGIAASSLVLRPLTSVAAKTFSMASGDWGEPLFPSRIREVDDLIASFNRMSEDLRKSQKELHEKEERLSLALKGADLGTWDWNVGTGEVRFNERWAEMLGYAPGELDGNLDTWSRLLCPEDEPSVMEVLRAHLDGQTPYYETEHRLKSKTGAWVWVLDKGKVTHRDAEGKPLRAVGTHLDITDRKATENALRNLVEEKELLMKELQHRVKNNLLMIDSLLNLEMNDLEDEKALAVLKATRTRLRSMAGIYEVLYKHSGVKVDFRSFADNLVEYMKATFVHDGRISIRSKLEDIGFELKDAVPLSLILNELVTNALKYAYPNGAKGEIRIDLSLKESSIVELRVSDDGVGLPEGFKPETCPSLGFKLVALLVKQLQGELVLGDGSSKGASVCIRLNLLG